MFVRRGLILGLLALAATSVSADVLHLKRGGRVEGIVVRETPVSVTLDIGTGQVSFPKTSVSRIERKDGVLAEYRARLAHLDRGDLKGYLDLARFATDAGLRSESASMWARVASLDPQNVEAHLALGHVLVDGRYVDEGESNRLHGLIYYDGRWMTPTEQEYMLREREQRFADDRRVEESRRMARDADERARRAEAEAARARADAAASLPVWAYENPVVIGSPGWGGYSAGCRGRDCSSVPQIWPVPQPPSAPRPLPRVTPLRPQSIR